MYSYAYVRIVGATVSTCWKKQCYGKLFGYRIHFGFVAR
jgi:hypothetical protein